MSALRALVADDEPGARQLLRSLLEKEGDIEVVGECATGAETIDAVTDQAPDLLFLDIEMPGRNGFEVLEQLPPGRIPAVVFVTAYEAYALDAFRIDAIDYLLKPYDAERLRETLSRVRRRLTRGGPSAEQWLSTLQKLATRGRPLERVAVLDGDVTVVIKTAEVRWMQSEANYVRLHVVSGKSYLARSTLRSLERQLDPARFVRIHRATIVGVDSIKELRPAGHGDLRAVLVDGTELSLSRRYRAGLERVVKRLV